MRGYGGSLYTFAMSTMLDHPMLFFPLIVALLFLAGAAGVWLKATRDDAVSAASGSLRTLENAVLGLLGLLLGFSFAMGVSRYDARKQLEVEEANAIGTTWLRTDALDAPTRDLERQVLKDYVRARMGFLSAGTDATAIQKSLTETSDLQNRLWTTGADYVGTHRDAMTALFLSSLNETIDDAEKRTAAFENRIPIAAWVLLLFISASASGLVGMGMSTRSRPLLILLPLVVGAAMTLILDLDSPRSGFVVVNQKSMERVAEEMNAPVVLP